MRPTPGAFLTCREMCGNGSATGRRTILTGAQTDPEGPASGSYRVIRGGSWYSVGTLLRSAERYGITPGSRLSHVGFRVGFQPVQPDTMRVTEI